MMTEDDVRALIMDEGKKKGFVEPHLVYWGKFVLKLALFVVLALWIVRVEEQVKMLNESTAKLIYTDIDRRFELLEIQVHGAPLSYDMAEKMLEEVRSSKSAD